MSNYTSTIDASQETFKFVGDINKEQFKIIDCLGRDNHQNISVLFNKGRYFEMSIYNKDLLISISKAIKCKIQYNNMLVGSKDKLEALVKAFNKRNYYVNINVDWI